jgi:hypothetical protein
VNDALTALDEALGELDGRKGRLAAEHRAVPPDTAVCEAHTRAAEQRKRRQELREARAFTERRSPGARGALRQANARLAAGRPRANQRPLRNIVSRSNSPEVTGIRKLLLLADGMRPAEI